MTIIDSDIYVLGIGATRVGRQPDRSFTDLAGEAYSEALKDCRMETGDGVKQVWFSNVLMDYWGQSACRGQAVLTPILRAGLLPPGAAIVNVEAGCASAAAALDGAMKDVRSGAAQLSVAIGVEKMNDPDRPGGVIAHIDRTVDRLNPDAWEDVYRQMAAECECEFKPAPDHSIAIDIYGVWTQSHMARYGTTAEQIAASAAKNHTNAVDNPRAQYRFPMSVQQVLADRPVVAPLTRAMCAPTGDGAAAVVVCSGSHLRGLAPEVRDRALRISGHALAGGTFDAGWDADRAPVIAARRAFRQAGIAPSDVDVVELHDATSFAEIHLVEDLGFCDRGEGGPFTASGATQRSAATPVNPSGGLVSRGHPIGATGIVMLNEIALQLRGEADAVQVADARVGLAENGGGVLGRDVAVSAVTILERTA